MDEDMLWLIIGIIIAAVILFVIVFVVLRLPSFWEWRYNPPG
ncbi:MAG: hypothetical protein ABIM21_04085 [candidate division WOR-3 bacterium]